MLSKSGAPLPLAIAGTCILLGACQGPQKIAGDCAKLFDGNICTWATLEDGKVTAFGATVPMATIENAPAEGPMVFPPVADAVIALPAAVAKDTGFNHFSVNWEKHGHPPALFFTPHFDFHFYVDEPGAVAAIDCSDLSKPERLPTGYALPDIEVPDMGVLTGACVPGMGMHSLPAADLDNTEPFGASLVVGYYEMQPSFVEPMISRAKLMEAKSFAMTVPALPENSRALRWPGRAGVNYDAATKSYTLILSDLPPS